MPFVLRTGMAAAMPVLGSALPAAAQASHDPSVFYQVQVEEAEYRYTDDDEESFNWDADAWIGGDFNQLRVKSEGAWVLDDEVEEAEIQALYSRNIGDFFDAVVGARYDFEPADTAFAVIGLQGTGDQLRNNPFTMQSLTAMLERMGINVADARVQTRNTAAVIVTATLPAFARQGTLIDVQASSLGDSRSISLPGWGTPSGAATLDGTGMTSAMASERVA